MKKIRYRTVIFYIVPGNRYAPVDLRGKRAGSRGTHRGAKAWANWLRMMQKKHGPSWAYKPKQQTALESAWSLV
jgi:hypothetical protein